MNTLCKTFSILATLALLITVAGASAASAQTNVVVVSTSIQAAVDAANPGDTVRVPPGTYRENVLVTKDNITIEGSHGAVLDGTDLPGTSGITVRSLNPLARITGFRVTGLQIQNYR